MCLPYSLDGGSCSSSKLRYIILNVKFQFQAKHTICQVGKMHLIIIHYLLGGIPTPLKNISQLVWLFPVHGKIQAMFQTTNQLYVTPILSQVYTPWIVASTPNRMAQIPPGLWCTSASAPPGHCNKPIDSGLSTSRHHLRPLQSQLSPDWDVDPVCSWGYSIVQQKYNTYLALAEHCVPHIPTDFHHLSMASSGT